MSGLKSRRLGYWNVEIDFCKKCHMARKYYKCEEAKNEEKKRTQAQKNQRLDT